MQNLIKKIKILSLVAVLVIAWGATQSVQADITPGFDAILFDPAVDNSDYFTVRSSQNLPKRGVHVGLYLDYARKPLELAAPLGTPIRSINENMLIANVLFSYGFTDWFSVGLNIPIVGWNDFIDPTTGVGKSQTNMGDIYLEAKFR